MQNTIILVLYIWKVEQNVDSKEFISLVELKNS